MAELTPAQFRAKLDKLEKGIRQIRPIAATAGIKTLEGDMKRRVFNLGQGTSKPLGPYKSEAYKRFRSRKPFGRQVAYKDLEFTGRLRGDMITGVSKFHPALGFQTDYGRDVAAWQEEQLKIFVWRPSDEELKSLLKAMVSTINKRLIKVLR